MAASPVKTIIEEVGLCEGKGSRAKETVDVVHETVDVVHDCCEKSAPPPTTNGAIPYMRVSRDTKVHADAIELSNRVGPLDDTRKVYGFIGPQLEHEDQEVFLVLPLNLRAELKSPPYEIARGQRSSTVVGVEDVMRAVLESGCEGFIVVHNHPSGKPTPSKADRELTKQIQRATDPFGKGLTFLDHVVIGTRSCYSIMEGKAYDSRQPSGRRRL